MPFAQTGELAALGAAMCWTVTALAFENAGRRIGSLAVNLIRLVLALAILSVACVLMRGRPFPTDASGHAWLWLGLSGLVGFTVGDLCLFRALVVVGSRLATLMMALVPPICALLGWLIMGEVLGALDWLGMAFTLGGVTLVVSEKRQGNKGDPSPGRIPLHGVLLGLGGALGQAVGLVLSKFGMGSYDPMASTQIRVMAGIVGFAVVFSIVGWWPRTVASLRDGRAMAFTGIGAFFGPFLGVTLSLVAVGHTDTGVASTIMALSPVLIIPAAILVNKDRVSPRSIVGAVAAVVGTALLFV